MQSPETSKAERTRRFIIEKVAPVFNKKGYAATSLADLTAATGLSKGSIYGNFKNKDEVALESFEYNQGYINRKLTERIERAGTCREKLLAYPETFRAISQTVLKNGGCPILNTSVDSNELNDLLHDAVKKKIEVWERVVVSLVENGKQAGEFSVDADGGRLAKLMICLVEGGYAMTNVTGDRDFFEHALTNIERLVEEL